MQPSLIASAFALSLLVGCAGSKPIDVSDQTLATTSMSELTQSDTGERFLWGGVIVETRNLEAGSEIEILAYPLNQRQHPRTSQSAIGRFLVDSDDYLEAVDYAEGRRVTVMGVYEGLRQGTVGETPYDFPVLNATTVHLWPIVPERNRPQFTIGVGFEL